MTVRKLSELQGRPVCTADGRKLGQVQEVRVRRAGERYEVECLLLGAGGLLVRLGVKGRGGDEVAWDRVTAITEDRITVSG
jgi:sporulation protein YlmC with PRC-barrel domain